MLKFGNDILKVGTSWIDYRSQPGPPLPPYTIRLRYTEGITPSVSKGVLTQVSSVPNIWDLTYENNDWGLLLQSGWPATTNTQVDLLEVISANTTGVIDMSSLFSGCYNLTNIALFDTSSVTDMRYMFLYCRSLTSVPLFDTSKITDMFEMFTSCNSLTEVPLFDTSNVTNMRMAFSGCALTTIPLLDTSSVTDMSSMFQGCRRLINVPLLDTHNVTNMGAMFNQCLNLKEVPLLNTSSVTNMYTMFSQCYNVESGALALYRQASSQSNPPSNHAACFQYCGRDTVTGAAELAQIPTSWGGKLE